MKIHGSGMGRDNGSPDYHVVIDGKFIGMEAKGWKGKVYPNQYDFAERILKSGGRYIVVYPDIDVDDVLENELTKVVYHGDNMMKTLKETHELILPNEGE